MDLEPGPEIDDLASVFELLVGSGTGRTAAYVEARDAPYPTNHRAGLSGVRSLGEGDDPRATAELFVAALRLVGELELVGELGEGASVDVDLAVLGG